MNQICKAIAGMGIKCTTQEATLEQFDAQFAHHVAEHNLNFPTVESYEFRKAAFALRDAEIEALNLDPENTWIAGHNFLSALTPDERNEYKGRIPTKTEDLEMNMDIPRMPTASSVDWRSKGAVNPVQNQGRCGSCWAFSSTAAIEGDHFIQTGDLLKLSEQNLVDCDTHSNGCDGGLEVSAFKYVEKHAQESEHDYPYKGHDSRCRWTSRRGKVTVKSYNRVQPKSVPDLMAAVEIQPTCVAVDAEGAAFQSYNSGILNSTSCGNNLDHAVTAVGYGVEGGVKYLIVRNSWTASWGEHGYIRMSMEVTGDGVCGVLDDASRPTTS